MADWEVGGLAGAGLEEAGLAGVADSEEVRGSVEAADWEAVDSAVAVEVAATAASAGTAGLQPGSWGSTPVHRCRSQRSRLSGRTPTLRPIPVPQA